MKYYHYLGLLGLFVSLLSGCASNEVEVTKPQLDEMESLILCKDDAQGVTIISKVKAEYGFKRFAKNTYRPVLERRLFGHDVRVIEFSEDSTKVYAAGTPAEFVYNLKDLLPDITCEKDTCQAPLENGQSLLVYKPGGKKNQPIRHKLKAKRVKDTTILECTRPPQEELPEGTE